MLGSTLSDLVYFFAALDDFSIFFSLRTPLCTIRNRHFLIMG